MRTNVLSFCSDVVKFQGRLESIYINNATLKKFIHTNEEETEFWIEPYKIDVQYGVNESYCCSKVQEHQARGIPSFEDSARVPSIIEILNIDPVTGENDPVLEVWGIGEVLGENCIYEALSDERKAKILELNPPHEDEDGNITKNLIEQVLT